MYLMHNLIMDKLLILNKIQEHYGFKKDIKFAEFLGIPAQNLSKWKSRGTYDAELIYTKCTEINPEWLLTGRGKMIKDNTEVDHNKPEEKKGIPLIPIEAMGGYGKGDSQVMQYDVSSGYNIPELEGKGVKYLIRVSGSSMYPKYSNGDLLACKPLEDLSFFQWGKPYVLDTEQGAIVKRLFPCDDDSECLECRSDNKVHYPPFRIPKLSVRAVAIVVGVIRLE